MTLSPENPKSNANKIFFNLHQKTCWICKRLELLSRSFGWRDMSLQSFAKNVSHAGLRGLQRHIVWRIKLYRAYIKIACALICNGAHVNKQRYFGWKTSIVFLNWFWVTGPIPPWAQFGGGHGGRVSPTFSEGGT